MRSDNLQLPHITSNFLMVAIVIMVDHGGHDGHGAHVGHGGCSEPTWSHEKPTWNHEKP